MSISDSRTRQKYPLSPTKPLKKTVTATIGWTLVLLIVYGLIVFGYYLYTSSIKVSMPTNWLLIGAAILIVILILVTAIEYIYQKLYFNSYFYDFTDSFIVIRKGVIMPREISIPYERVQDIYVDQDLWDRIFRLYDVHLSTATVMSGMEAHIDGLEKEAADGLRHELLKTVGEKLHRKPVVAATSSQIHG